MTLSALAFVQFSIARVVFYLWFFCFHLSLDVSVSNVAQLDIVSSGMQVLENDALVSFSGLETLGLMSNRLSSIGEKSLVWVFALGHLYIFIFLVYLYYTFSPFHSTLVTPTSLFFGIDLQGRALVVAQPDIVFIDYHYFLYILFPCFFILLYILIYIYILCALFLF